MAHRRHSKSSRRSLLEQGDKVRLLEVSVVVTIHVFKQLLNEVALESETQLLNRKCKLLEVDLLVFKPIKLPVAGDYTRALYLQSFVKFTVCFRYG